MRNIVLLIFLLIFPAISYSAPTIQFDEYKYDFGLIEPGGTVEHTFEFENTGSDDLIIEKLVPS
jgi:hypothetical protein